MKPDDSPMFAVGVLFGALFVGILGWFISRSHTSPAAVQRCALYWSYTRTHVDTMQVLFRCGAPK